MKEIPLTQGKVALVDDADYEWLMQWKWSLLNCKGGLYVHRKPTLRGKQATVLMHRLIMDVLNNSGTLVDHRNHDGLDNRRCNLRLCTHQQNLFHRNAIHSASGFRGVTKAQRRRKPWLAQIGFDGQNQFLGYHATAEEAALAYDVAARELFGEFASCNFEG